MTWDLLLDLFAAQFGLWWVILPAILVLPIIAVALLFAQALTVVDVPQQFVACPMPAGVALATRSKPVALKTAA